MAPRSSQQCQIFLVGAHHPPTHGVNMGSHRNQHKQRAVCLHWHCIKGAKTAQICSSSLADQSLGSLTCPKYFSSLAQPHSQTPGMLPHTTAIFISLCKSPSLYPVIGSGLFFYCVSSDLLASPAQNFIAKNIHAHI